MAIKRWGILMLSLLVHACCTTPSREFSADDEQRLRAMIEDRSTWIDPNSF